MDAPTSRRRASRGRGSTRPAGHGPRRARAPRRATSAPSSWTSLRASDHVGKWTWESVNAGRAHRPRRSTRSGVGSALSCVPTPPTTRSPAIARRRGGRQGGIHGADDAVRQDHAPEPSARIGGATIGSRPEDRLSFDRPLALLSLAVLAVLAAGFVTLARRRPRVRRPLPERRRPARRLVARERGAAVCAARARHRRARPPRRRNGRAARDEVGAGRERNRRAGRRHVAVDALDRRPADAAGRGQDSGTRGFSSARPTSSVSAS